MENNKTMPEGMPKTMPGIMPGTMPGTMPESMPKTMPGTMPESMPKTMPGTMPESMMTYPMRANPSLRLQPANQLPIYQTDNIPKFTGNMANQIVYPELFYKLQPFIMMVCDQIDTYSFGSMIPTQDMIEQLSDSIYDDVSRMYPDIAEYAGSVDKKANEDVPVITGLNPDMFDRNFGMFRRRFRRRGVLRDLIDILLISEFFRRRRTY